MNVDEIERYIGMYFSLQRKAEEGPLSEAEQEQLALCEHVLQKRRELEELDCWLEEAFGMKLEPHPETCNASVQQVMDPEPKTPHLRHRDNWSVKDICICLRRISLHFLLRKNDSGWHNFKKSFAKRH